MHFNSRSTQNVLRVFLKSFFMYLYDQLDPIDRLYGELNALNTCKVEIDSIINHDGE